MASLAGSFHLEYVQDQMMCFLLKSQKGFSEHTGTTTISLYYMKKQLAKYNEHF